MACLSQALKRKHLYDVKGLIHIYFKRLQKKKTWTTVAEFNKNKMREN